jgi:hypothetical protein
VPTGRPAFGATSAQVTFVLKRQSESCFTDPQASMQFWHGDGCRRCLASNRGQGHGQSAYRRRLECGAAAAPRTRPLRMTERRGAQYIVPLVNTAPFRARRSTFGVGWQRFAPTCKGSMSASWTPSSKLLSRPARPTDWPVLHHSPRSSASCAQLRDRDVGSTVARMFAQNAATDHPQEQRD